MKYILILLFSFIAVFTISSKSWAGEIDGKGLVCGPVGYFFDHSTHTFYLERNGDLLKEDMGVKYDCKLAIGYPSFIKMLTTNLENIKNKNKI